MDNRLSMENLVLKQRQIDASVALNKEYIWKNIFKVEALRKENSLRKSQNLCKNLQIKYEKKI